MESLRLHPPFSVVSYEKKSKCPFHRNSVYVVSIDSVHKSIDHWDDPYNYNPTRFSVGLKNAKKGSYIPFGGNDRKCPGAAMSMSVGPKMIAEIFKRVRFLEFWHPIIKKRATPRPDNNTFYVRMTNA